MTVTETQKDLTPTPISAWKGLSSGPEEQAVELPSGNVMRIRVTGMEAFISSGKIPNSLLGFITAAFEANKRGKDDQDKPAAPKFDEQKMMKEIINDPEKLADMLSLTDIVAATVVVEPPVKLPPTELELQEGAERVPMDDDRMFLYTDEIAVQDKMFIFGVAVGGTKDLERFREGSTANVVAVSARKPVAKAAKRTSRAKKR